MLEEKIGDLHSFRKNLLMISLGNILIIIFAPKIIDINLILFKLKDIDDIKIYFILFIINFYTLIRYLQYRKIKPLSKNYMFLFKKIINKGKIKKWIQPNNYKDFFEKIIINQDRNIIAYHPTVGTLPTIQHHNILQDKTYKVELIQNDVNDKNSAMLILSKSNGIKTNGIKDYNNIYAISFNRNEVNDKFLLLDRYYADIEMPWILGAFSTMLIFLPVYDYILKNLYYFFSKCY